MLAMAIGFFIILLIFLATLLRPEEKAELSSENPQKKSSAKEIDKTKIAKMSPADLSEILQTNKNKTLVVIDIRDREEFLAEHIPHSQNIPFENLSQAIVTLKKENRHVIVDNLVKIETINTIGELFSQNGLRDIAYLEGGFNNWKHNYFWTVSRGNPESLIDQSKVKYITSVELKALIEKESELFLLDVRKATQFSAGHLPKAHNIFLEDLEKKVDEIPFGKTIVIYDDNSFDAFMAAVRLFDLGFARTLTLSDGFASWQSKGYVIEK